MEFPEEKKADNKIRLSKVYTAHGPLEAEVIKSHLESEGIPYLLQYESASHVIGVTVDGLGQVDILVPEDLAEEAMVILRAKEVEDQ